MKHCSVDSLERSSVLGVGFRDRPCGARPARSAFTLIEMLVVMAILAILISILLPALVSVRESVKSLHCSSNLRSIVLAFEGFAQGTSSSGQGESEALGTHRFRMNDFQESLYGLDEFWDAGEVAHAELEAGSAMMLCPDGAPRLSKAKGLPCSAEAISPTEGVSLAMNMRLYRPAIRFKGKKLLAPAASANVHASILHHPYVPLVLDVDGDEAARRGLDPFYTAPPLRDVDDPYASGRFWMLSKRHRNKTNVAFVGGHVLSTTDPTRERWDWAYQADVR